MPTRLTDLIPTVNEPLSLDAITSHPVLTQVLNWWRSARDGGLPAKVDPLELPPSVLPYLMLVDLHGDDDASIRLAGTKACELYGGEMRGLALSDFFTPQDGASVLRDLHATHESGQPSLARRSYVCVGDKFLSYTRLLLPIRGYGDRPKQVLKVLEPQTFEQTRDDRLLESPPKGRPTTSRFLANARLGVAVDVRPAILGAPFNAE